MRAGDAFDEAFDEPFEDRLDELGSILERHDRLRSAGHGVVTCVIDPPPGWVPAARASAVVAPAGALEAAWPAWLEAGRARLRPAALALVARTVGKPVVEVTVLLAQGNAESAAMLERAAGALGGEQRRGVLEALGPRPAIEPARAEPAPAEPFEAVLALASLGAPLPLLWMDHPQAEAVAQALSLTERCPALPIVVVLAQSELERVEGSLPTAWRDRLRAGLVTRAPRAAGPGSAVAQARPEAEGALARLAPLLGAQVATLVPFFCEARDALDGTDGERARSLAERLLHRALEAIDETHGLFLLNHRLGGVRFGPADVEIDLAAPSIAIAIEVDGPFHFIDARSYRRDRRKDALLQRHGYLVLRALASDVVERLDEVVETILENVRHARRERGAP